MYGGYRDAGARRVYLLIANDNLMASGNIHPLTSLSPTALGCVKLTSEAGDLLKCVCLVRTKERKTVLIYLQTNL